MNKTLSILLLIFFMNVFKIDAQINKPEPFKNEQHNMADFFLKKSKNQKTAAWILLGGGAGVALAGDIIGTNAIKNSNPDELFPRGSLAGGGMLLGGVIATIASIPFFIASGKNKKIANLIFKNESQSFLHRLHKANSISVGVSLKL